MTVAAGACGMADEMPMICEGTGAGDLLFFPRPLCKRTGRESLLVYFCLGGLKTGSLLSLHCLSGCTHVLVSSSGTSS